MTKVEHSETSVDLIVSELIRRGYTLLGEGFYSQVYYHISDPDAVIKITCCDPDRLEDGPYLDGWLNYIYRFAVIDEAYKSPHTPIIFELTIFEDGYAAKMERLYRVDNWEYCQALDMPITKEILNYGAGRTDLHQANVMKRVCNDPDNPVADCLVITDPYV